VVLTALKPAADGTAVLRVHEAIGRPTSATIRLAAKLAAAEEVNLLEDAGKKLAVGDGVLQVDLRPFEIKSIKLWLEPQTAVAR
jgi:alpha-mannosidase